MDLVVETLAQPQFDPSTDDGGGIEATLLLNRITGLTAEQRAFYLHLIRWRRCSAAPALHALEARSM